MNKFKKRERINLQKGESPQSGSGNPIGSEKAELKPFSEKDIPKKDLIVDPKSVGSMEEWLDDKIAKEKYDINADNENINSEDMVYKGNNFEDKPLSERVKKERELKKQGFDKIEEVKKKINDLDDNVLDIENEAPPKTIAFKNDLRNHKRGKNSKYTYKDRPEGLKVVEKKHRVKNFLNKLIGK